LSGLWQTTPIKHACLRQCRSPVSFLATHWRVGRGGAFRMGLTHGAYCLGCCWILMALLFFGGVMNLWWVDLLMTGTALHFELGGVFLRTPMRPRARLLGIKKPRRIGATR
jgi:predicted metal-binding membrane protein